MRRDFSTIRELLLRLESFPLKPGHVIIINPHDAEFAIEGKSPDEIDYHLGLIKEAGLIVDHGPGSLAGGYRFSRLSWVGHDFVDSVRDPEIWRHVERRAEQVKAATIDLLVEIAKGFIRTKIEQHTGVKV